MSKKQLTQEEVLAAKQEMKKIAYSSNREDQIARIINETYDPEFPVPEIISSIFNVATAESHEVVYYFVPTLPEKKAYVLASGCVVTQIAVTPTAKNTLAMVPVVTPDYYICLGDLLNGEHNVLDLYAEDILEALNREEIYSVLALVDAGAIARGNVFAPDSGKTTLEYPKLVEMKKSIRKYGKKLVLITGGQVTDDVELMQYAANKFQAINIKDIVDMWIPLESLEVTIDGVVKEVISEDVAYLVAVSDSKRNKPGYFVRRKISSNILAGLNDTSIVDKERAIIVTGTNKATATVERFAKGIAGLEEIGAVLTNSYCVAKFEL
jgi:hypothetical protein